MAILSCQMQNGNVKKCNKRSPNKSDPMMASPELLTLYGWEKVQILRNKFQTNIQSTALSETLT